MAIVAIIVLAVLLLVASGAKNKADRHTDALREVGGAWGAAGDIGASVSGVLFAAIVALIVVAAAVVLTIPQGALK